MGCTRRIRRLSFEGSHRTRYQAEPCPDKLRFHGFSVKGARFLVPEPNVHGLISE